MTKENEQSSKIEGIYIEKIGQATELPQKRYKRRSSPRNPEKRKTTMTLIQKLVDNPLLTVKEECKKLNILPSYFYFVLEKHPELATLYNQVQKEKNIQTLTLQTLREELTEMQNEDNVVELENLTNNKAFEEKSPLKKFLIEEKKGMKRKILAYLRVSTLNQELQPQKEAIQNYCKKTFIDEPVTFFEEKVSGLKKDCVAWQNLINNLNEGDIVIAYSLSCLSRRLTELLSIVELLQTKKVHLCLVKEQIDTSTSTGSLIFNIFGILRQYEAELISERTKIALESKRKRGIKGGRKPASLDRINAALDLYDMNKMTVGNICKQERISRPTFYKYLKIRNNKKK